MDNNNLGLGIIFTIKDAYSAECAKIKNSITQNELL